MDTNLELWTHCKKCIDGCCYRGVPLVTSAERERIIAEHPDHFEPFGNNFVIPKPNGYCPYLELDTGRCSIHEVKPVDCQIYPLDPFYNGENIEFVVDTPCPASRHLTPEFINAAMSLAQKWIKLFPRPEFEDYFERYKKSNPRQELRKLDELFDEKIIK